MKITRDAYDMATAAAKETDVPLILVGSKGVITDVMISPTEAEFDTSAGMLPSMMPAGIRRYGKIITRTDTDLEAGYNLIEENGQWKFVDDSGHDVSVEIVDTPADEKYDELLEGLDETDAET
ncbi:MAG TPA: hypothetical protein VGK13_07695 [Methanocellaceae archaeon]|jgi:hypothetical protein